jgi:hypothetical protein
MDESPDPSERARRGIPLLAQVGIAVVLFAAGTAFGVVIAPGDEDRTASRSPAAASVAADRSSAATVPAAVPLGLEPTLRAYLGALVSHDWPTAHALMCADLGEQVSAGALKQELAGSEKKAGLLQGYTITAQPPTASHAVKVSYVLRFAHGSIDIQADLEEEGAAWRVCSFTNGHGTGAFA